MKRLIIPIMKNVILPIFKILIIAILSTICFPIYLGFQVFYFTWEFQFMKYSEFWKNECKWGIRPTTYDNTPKETIIRWWNLEFKDFTHTKNEVIYRKN